MLKNRFFRVNSKGIIYNEKYFGTKASFNSYIEGFENFKLEEDKKEREHELLKDIVVEDQETLVEPILVSQDIINKPVSPTTKSDPSSTSSFTNLSRQALQALQELRKGNNLEKFLEAHGLSTSGGSSSFSIPQLKQAFDKFLSKNEQANQEKEISKWTTQLENLKALRNSKELEKWLESKGVAAANVSIPAIQKELQKYFQKDDPQQEVVVTPKIDQPTWGKRSTKNANKTGHDKSPSVSDAEALVSQMKEIVQIENIMHSDADITIPQSRNKQRVPRDFGPCMRVEDFKARSLFLQEGTLANKIWEDFKGMSIPKQIAVVIGITVVTAALGYVSWRILLLAFPSVFQMNHYWAEVLSQWFMYRQESTYHLLQHTAQNAKPLSTAWANQYLLWKYI